MIKNAPRRRSHWMAPLVAVAAATLLTAGCSSSTPANKTQPAIAPSTPALPKCGDLFKAGQKIDQAKAAAGCSDPDGGVQMVGSFRCNDGRHLWQVDASTGAQAGWGIGGDVYHLSKEAASDPGYKAAYNSCMG